MNTRDRWLLGFALMLAHSLVVHAEPASTPPSEDIVARVDAVFADVAADGPGVAVAVVQDTHIVYQATFGLANLEHGIPITAATVFDIASISKQFAGMTAVLLERDGVVDLDDLVHQHVPTLGDFGAAITLRQLLHHTGGLRDWPMTLKIAGVEFDDVISFSKIKKMIERQQALNFAPGSAYAYSNTGYNLLADALGNASGQTFRELTNERIFEPLGMHSSFFLDDYREIVSNVASSYTPGINGWLRNRDQLTALASSSLHTTIADFTRWMVNFETKTVGGVEGFAALTTRGRLNDGTTLDYAKGIGHGTYRNQPMLRHGGSWAGFRTTFMHFPNHAFSVAVFANYATARPARRAERITDIFLEGILGPAPEPANINWSQVEPQPFAGLDLAHYVGAYYSSELDTTYSLAIKGETLVASHFRNDSVRLAPTGPDSFRGDQWWFANIRFSRGAGGDVDGFEINADRVRGLRFTRREP